ncbi:DUF1684 domain-containing protein [Actinophytocola algeriensis]|uniref:DUF1684 domain-containing protein n=1 Tax=Actinophytocola algeriensis TaxID=1768010 RepID=A0A7W7QEK7_9PSEU|nr:DUF1684 domain-containing protein [Actinophytocola algeriensis]MBB4911696.1 hypothetical protein [Actinophytocola algeriensis]MBE1473316.1 uncharacterized protein (DUF1684 family) [Actinophytocola algeriensis]
MSPDTTYASSARFVHRWQQWKVARERELAHPYGWLALVSLDWLSYTPQEYPGVPGKWWQDNDAAYVDPDGAELAAEGAPLTGVHRFELVNSGAGARVAFGDVEIEVARRSGYLVRVHDPSAPALALFAGVPTYDPDPGWVVRGRFEPFERPRPVTVGAVVEGLSHVYASPGVVRFEHDGVTHTLTAFNGLGGDGLSILFTDATSGVTTYAANRALDVESQDDGEVRLDFNRARNLPCAFTDFATCPLPPPGNHLPFAVTAGELLPYERRRDTPAPRQES